jgi:hypothetical protein
MGGQVDGPGKAGRQRPYRRPKERGGGKKWVCSVVVGSGEFGALNSASVLIWDVEHENQAAWGQGVR